MYSDDEGGFGDRYRRSPSQENIKWGEKDTSQQGGKGKGKGDGKGGGKGGKSGGSRSRTTGTAMPKLHSIHKGTIVSVRDYGAFVRLGSGSEYKDGLLHISRLSISGRVEAVSDVVAEEDTVWVKVCEIKDEEGKYSLDMRFVGQKDGEDKDPNNIQADAGGGAKGKGKGPEPIRIGAIQSATCSKCGAKGHTARECWSAGGKNYELLEETPAERELMKFEQEKRKPVKSAVEDPPLAVPGHDPKIVKEALRAYLKRKKPDASESDSSSDSSSASDSDSDKKAKKKKKSDKKDKKKDKKSKKKKAKTEKKVKKDKKEKKEKTGQSAKDKKKAIKERIKMLTG